MRSSRQRSRRLGQHFLVDRRAVERILDALDPRPGDTVVEIGPGSGALTEGLLQRAARVAAVEIDAQLVARLRRRFQAGSLVVVQGDVLRHEIAALGRVAGWPAVSKLLVVGNLPYHISKPLALKLVSERRAVGRAVLMFQKEVAERLTAQPGTRAYGPLTVLCGQAYRIEHLFDLAPGAFRPPPEVLSTVTRWAPAPGEGLEPALERALRACLAGCFARRRQTLRNNLRAALGSEERADALLEAVGLDGRLRAEALPPERFLHLARHWPRAALL